MEAPDSSVRLHLTRAGPVRRRSRAVQSVNREIRQRRAFVIVHRSFVIARKSPNDHRALIDCCGWR
jgi:hypothetical protein